MKIDLVEITNKIFKDKELTIEDVSEDKVKICYRNKRTYRSMGGSDPRPYILPKLIDLDKEFAEAIGLYLGDGKTTKKDVCHLDFVSKDKDIVKFMLSFFIKRLLVSLDCTTITIKYKDGNEEEILEKWSKWLKIPKNKFKISFQSRNKYETVSIQVNSSVLRGVFFGIINCSLNIIKNNVNLRRGFLRGYFAAEGIIGYNKKENYLNYIGFSYNPKTEAWLKDYCMECLTKENIKSSFKERKNNRAEIIISGWPNYWKLWSIGIFDRCERKKARFFEIFSSRKIYCNLNKKSRKLLFNSLNMSQKEIARIINSYQGNVCKIIKGKHLLTINQIKNLLSYTNLSIKYIFKNTKAIRVGNGKHQITDKNLIKNALKLSTNQENLYF